MTNNISGIGLMIIKLIFVVYRHDMTRYEIQNKLNKHKIYINIHKKDLCSNNRDRSE